jgi:hypothetical protein
MRGFWELNLIHFFNFYLGLMFLASCYMRVTQYRAILGLVREVPSRWPNLFTLIRQYAHIFLTWSTVMPLLVALGLFLINFLASRMIWPSVDLTPNILVHGYHWVALPLILTLGLAMVGVDGYATFAVGEVDRKMMQEYFDQAEYWLRSWTAPLVHVFTLGHVNPRRMVRVEVQKALVEASKLINESLWWVVLQTGVRIAFGLALWLTYAWIQVFG